MEPTLTINAFPFPHKKKSSEYDVFPLILYTKIYHTPQAACRKAYSIVDSQLSLTLNKITSVSTCTCITDYI